MQIYLAKEDPFLTRIPRQKVKLLKKYVNARVVPI